VLFSFSSDQVEDFVAQGGRPDVELARTNGCPTAIIDMMLACWVRLQNILLAAGDVFAGLLLICCISDTGAIASRSPLSTSASARNGRRYGVKEIMLRIVKCTWALAAIERLGPANWVLN
jgi:hypothetical protein